MNAIFKQIYNYTRSRAYRHNEYLWPFCHISRAKTGEITQLRYKRQSIPIVPLSDWYHYCTGDALIIATGPSINAIDFTRLPSMTIVGVNGAYILKHQLDFKFYIIIDMSFIDNRTNIVRAIVTDPALTLFTTLHGIVRIINRFTLMSVRCQLALIEDACYRIYQPRVPYNDIYRCFSQNPHIQFNSDHPNIAFTTDIRDGIFDAGTVVFWALQILFYLGFTRLYIAGLDMNNFHKPRFYETDYDKLPSFLAEKFTSIIVPAFTLASEVLHRSKIEVKNLSLDSALSNEIFEKVIFNDIFQN